ncbi:MAG: HPr-rel-A system PqqD family peptide chaperone [Gemmatimonadota bacterium]|nr:MAG: HPr-rel-A system PqqD family peptide chaperone [Gemmatimonadota bacterium]
MQPAGHPQAREDVLFRQVDDEWVVFDPAANELHVLNLAAALIWSHCTGEHAPDEIAGALQEAYGIELERAAADVQATLERFREAGLLRRDG